MTRPLHCYGNEQSYSSRLCLIVNGMDLVSLEMFPCSRSLDKCKHVCCRGDMHLCIQ